MRIARDRSGEFLGSVDGGPWVPLSAVGIDVADTPALIALGDAVERAVRGAPASVGRTDVDLACPVVRPSKMLGIGLNYLGHIDEQDERRPKYPRVFGKYPNSLTGPTDPIVVDPRLTEKADYESELAVIVGRRSRWLEPEQALAAVYGYAVANDVSSRDWQVIDEQFSRSKSMDTFCPLGPWITTADEVPDPHVLRVTCDVNGERRQDSTTARLLFDVVELLVYLSRSMTLEPGDVILTGTPHGVGFVMDPPQFLKPGDVVRCEVEGLGVIENPVVGPDAA
jgi:2-keto-4-pentenoate hydratase/2-oxohepta-3-ene-1,7-dioic acid hydratase in catechol pathway